MGVSAEAVLGRPGKALWERTFTGLKDRLSYELDTIKNMGYVDYFLIVWDFIKYAKDHGIAVGPGRGSAAGKYRFLLSGNHNDRSYQVSASL